MTADVIAGRFALCDPIGSGGSGTVWRAFDHKRDRYCAAKLLRQRDAGDLLRFVREQSVRLHHRHIVSPYSWVAEDGTVLIASELITGGSLHTLLGDFGPLAEDTVATVLAQVLSGLQAVHDAELIHRDVKPANLLLHATGDGPLHVVLTDFGLTISRLDARLTQVGMVIGTPGYVPPEVLQGGVPPDPRHDLYAVGRLALTMLQGAEPTGRLGPLIGSITDPTLRTAVEALLRHDPDDRPVDAVAAAALLPGARGSAAAELHRPRTRDGDRIEVLDQLPELPPGWGPDGPPAEPASGSSRSAAPRATIVDVVPTAPARLDEPTATVAVTAPDAPQADAPRVGAPQVGAPQTSGPQTGQPPATRSVATLPGAPTPSGPPASRRRGPIAAAVVVVLVAGAALVVWLLQQTSTGDPSQTTPVSPTTAVSTPATTSGQTTPGTGSTPVAPTATATPENLRLGDACTWQQEGDRRVGVDGTALVCSLADGTYQWRSPG